MKEAIGWLVMAGVSVAFYAAGQTAAVLGVGWALFLTAARIGVLPAQARTRVFVEFWVIVAMAIGGSIGGWFFIPAAVAFIIHDIRSDSPVEPLRPDRARVVAVACALAAALAALAAAGWLVAGGGGIPAGSGIAADLTPSPSSPLRFAAAATASIGAVVALSVAWALTSRRPLRPGLPRIAVFMFLGAGLLSGVLGVAMLPPAILALASIRMTSALQRPASGGVPLTRTKGE